MAKKIVKKVDVKKVAKVEVSKEVRELFEGLGVEVLDGADFGFTSGTLVARLEKCDVQIKLITPKAGIDRYESLEEEEEEVVEEIVKEEEVAEEVAKDEEVVTESDKEEISELEK